MIPENLINIKTLKQFSYNSGFKILDYGKLNIWGIRTPRGEFNDLFIYFWKNIDRWDFIIEKGTTEPGQGYLLNKMLNKNGTAILCHNHYYADCWEVRKHNGKYDALCQIYDYQFKVWRDANQNGVVDYGGNIYTDAQGINNHSTKLGYVANYIGNFSAGCQVVWNYANFTNKIMKVVKEKKQLHSNRYSYLLVTEDNFRRLTGNLEHKEKII